jgi:transcriptional antiterminator NusG
VRVNFDIGETIKVKEGPLKTFTGDITHIDNDTNKLKVNISIFGRETEVELGFDEVEKL